jgi:hypothetical protein
MVYQCSLCRQEFPLAEDVTPKEAVAKLYAEFKKHVQQQHR